MERKNIRWLLVLTLLVLSLTGCIKSKQENVIENTTVDGLVVENGIVDLSPETVEDSSEGATTEILGSVAGLDDITKADSEIETEAEIKSKIPKNVLIEEDKTNYELNGVKVQFEEGLVKDTFVEMQDGYVSEDGKTYLMHEVSKADDIDMAYIEKRFEKSNISKDKIYKGMIDDYSYIMAMYDEDDITISSMAYVFVGDMLHIFTVAKEGVTVSELRFIVSDMLESAKFEEPEVVESSEIETQEDFGKSIYWKDNSEIVEDTVDIVVGEVAHTKVGSNWTLLDGDNAVYHCGSSMYTVSMKFIKSDTKEQTEVYLSGYKDLLYKTFGEPIEENRLKFGNILWDEYVFRGSDYNGQNMNIGAYVGQTEKGIFYAEFSCTGDKELQYNYIMTVLENLTV